MKMELGKNVKRALDPWSLENYITGTQFYFRLNTKSVLVYQKLYIAPSIYLHLNFLGMALANIVSTSFANYNMERLYDTKT